VYGSYKLDNNTSISGGFHILSGEPEDPDVGQPFYEKEIDDQRIRNGVLFGGISRNGRSYEAGWNSTDVQYFIQNGWHSFIGSPHFHKQDYKARGYSRYRHGKYHTIF
jgi:hypothetical protein